MRGQPAENGTTRVAQNGYHYIKVNNKWRLAHHVEAEKMLGRPLAEDERVSFVNGKKDDLRWTNLVVTKRGTSSLRRRKAQIEARIEELQEELRGINKVLMK